MKKLYVTGMFLLLLMLALPAQGQAGRLNFMLTNLTGMDITDVRISPTYYPNYASENLLRTKLDPSTRIYIGPNYYGNQRYWNITLTWANGFRHTFTHSRLTRYNSYTVYTNSYGVRLRQGYERAFARYGQGPMPAMYSSPSNPEVQIYVGVPEKVNRARVAHAPQPSTANLVASNTRRRTRDLVFDDSEEAPAVEDTAAAKASGQKAIAMKATVELTRDGAVSTVLPSADFKSGDKVRLLFSSNSDGYVYWVAKGTSGTYQVLYPSKKTGMDNSVTKNTEYKVPSKGAWRFDDQKGTETLVCFLAPNKVADLDKAVQMATDGDKQGASKLIATLVDSHENKRTTRDLVFEEEDDVDVNTKTQRSAEGDTFVATYELMHN